MRNILFREMTLGWHIAWAVCYLTVYVAMFASGYLEHHVVWLGQQTLALVAGGTLAGISMRLRHS